MNLRTTLNSAAGSVSHPNGGGYVGGVLVPIAGMMLLVNNKISTFSIKFPGPGSGKLIVRLSWTPLELFLGIDHNQSVFAATL